MEFADSITTAIIDNCGENAHIVKKTPVSGGDINRAYALELSDGNKLFMKLNNRQNAA